jgi:acylphosphatase
MVGVTILIVALLFSACPTEPEDSASEEYSVTISAIGHGTIVATPQSGKEGDSITLTVNPGSGYRLKERSLKYNETVIENTTPPIEFNMPAGNVTVTAEFEQLSVVAPGSYSVTIATLQYGTITADPQYGPVGTKINLLISPDKGYGLKAGTLKYNDGTDHDITGTTFNLPDANVTVTAEFETKTAEQLVSSGTNALLDGNFDAAIDYFESAYQKDKTNAEAIVYSSLGQLAAIAKDEKVRDLMRTKLGLTGYPGTIGRLLTTDWMQDYTNEDFVEWYQDGGNWLSWYDSDYTPDGSGKAGYYRYESYDEPEYVFVTSTPKNEKLESYYDDAIENWVSWYDSDYTPDGSGKAGYYYWDQNTETYIFVTSTPKNGKLSYYYDDAIGKWVYWNDSAGSGEAGYYYTKSGEYHWVSSTPKYEYDIGKQPGLSVPDWFKDTGTYKDTLTATNLESVATWQVLLFANLVDKNPNGANELLDGILSSVFGDSFEAVATRVESLAYEDNIALDTDITEALGLEEIFEGGIYIGRAELDILIASLRVLKASLEWVTAYDWDTDLTFLRRDWKTLVDDIDVLNPTSLPFKNNFMKDRNNGMMDKSKADYIKAIDALVAAYDTIIVSAHYPQGIKDVLDDYRWVKAGLTEVKNTITNKTVFYLKEGSGATYTNSAANAIFGIDMGKLFTPGYLAINNLVTTEASGAPQFYGDDDELIIKKDDIKQYDAIGIQVKLSPIKALIVVGLELSDDDTMIIPVLPPDIGESIYSLYHK